MKKWILFLFCVVMMGFGLFAGCANNGGASETASPGNAALASADTAEKRCDSDAFTVENIGKMECIDGSLLEKEFLLSDDGFEADIEVLFAGQDSAIFRTDTKICMVHTESGKKEYYVLDLFGFGKADYRCSVNKTGSFLSVWENARQLLLVDVKSKDVLRLSGELDNLDVLSWKGADVCFKAENASGKTYYYTYTFGAEQVAEISRLDIPEADKSFMADKTDEQGREIVAQYLK